MRRGDVGADAMDIYGHFLREMFVAFEGKRNEFYRSMLAEAGNKLELSGAEFGENAEAFYEVADDSAHKKHLLVFYSVGLLLNVFNARYPGSDASATEEETEMMCRYFEKNLPLGAKFVNSANVGTMEKILDELALRRISLAGRCYGLPLAVGNGVRSHLADLLTACAGTLKAEASERAALKLTQERALAGNLSLALVASEHHYAAVAFCQTPGGGKSRSVESVVDVPAVCFFHVCLWPEGQPGAPIRTPSIAEAIDGCSTTSDFLAVITGCLET